jgi:hypothetical protein
VKATLWIYPKATLTYRYREPHLSSDRCTTKTKTPKKPKVDYQIGDFDKKSKINTNKSKPK